MRIYILLLSIFFYLTAFSQSAFEADASFNKRQYPEAAVLYAALLEKQPMEPLFNYRLARCYYEMKDFDNAIKYFIAGGTRYPLRDFYLGDSYFLSYRFKEAIEYYQSYMKSPATNAVFLREVDQKMKRATIALELMKKVAEVEIVDSIPCRRDDFIRHYSLSAETGSVQLQQVSLLRKGMTDLIAFVTHQGDVKYYSDTLVSSINLYKSVKINSGWSSGELIRNFPNGDENYPFVTGNGLKLFFASNGEQSIGGYDIFSAVRNNTHEAFHAQKNLGFPFNSIYNDYMLVVDEVSGVGWFVTDRFQPADKLMIYQFVYRGDEQTYSATVDQDLLRQLAMLKRSVKPGYAGLPKPAKAVKAVDNKPVEVQQPETKPVETVLPVVENTEVTIRPQKPVTEVNKPDMSPHPASKQIYFEINDEIVYTNVNQFKSAKALQAWNEQDKLSTELQSYETRLQKIRADYENATERVEKLRLTNEISSLEKAVVRLKLQVTEKLKMVRNEEIIVLVNQIK